MNDWKPIDTAPKNGYPVFVKGENYGKPNNGEHYEWGFWDGSAWKCVGIEGTTLLYLTHWMPKP